MSRSFALAVPLVAAASLAVQVRPAAAEDVWTARLVGEWVDTSTDAFSDLDDGHGASLTLERRIRDRWSVELGVGRRRVEGATRQSFDLLGFRVESRIDTEVEWTPVFVGGHLHLDSPAGFDVRVGARAGWAFLDDVRITSSVDISGDFGFPDFPGVPLDTPPTTLSLPADDAPFYGLHVGVDRLLGGGWGVTASLDWTVLELEVEPPAVPGGPAPDPGVVARTDLDPLALGLGIVKRW